ncbi:hypothetical protein [Calidifontibacter indicus]|uniref:hypothetical protein n=1 Tax=Calidifontibacter indicus TaxID=419650 RepID=UPI003D710DA6
MVGAEFYVCRTASTLNPYISFKDTARDELRGYWDKLSDGGQVTLPLEKQMWGDEFGTLTDKHGIAWMVNISGSGE